MQWSQAKDGALYAARETMPGATWEQLALVLSERLGEAVTPDQARNRYKRIQARVAAEEVAPVVPELEERFVTAAPPDGFIGFRFGFFDIETTDLKALMGRGIAASIVDSWGNTVSRTIGQFPQATPLDDSGLMEWLRDELEAYDIIVGWNHHQFDIGFMNARLLRFGKRPLKRMMSVDPMYKARGGRYGARIGSSKLDNVAKYFATVVQKPQPTWEQWQLAALGDPDAMRVIVERCEADAQITRLVFNHLKPLVTTVHE